MSFAYAFGNKFFLFKLFKLSLLCSLYLSTVLNWAIGGSRGNQVVVMFIVIIGKLVHLTLDNVNFIN